MFEKSHQVYYILTAQKLKADINIILILCKTIKTMLIFLFFLFSIEEKEGAIILFWWEMPWIEKSLLNN